jgi:hypothetical protein
MRTMISGVPRRFPAKLRFSEYQSAVIAQTRLTKEKYFGH